MNKITTVEDDSGDRWTFHKDRITAVRWVGEPDYVSFQAHVLLAGRERQPIVLNNSSSIRLWSWYRAG